MYCKEEIINVWYLQGLKGWENDGKGDWDFPDNLFGMDYYFAGKNGLVFQTEHYFITVRVDGVKTYRSKDEFLTPDVDMYNYDDWYDDDDDDSDDEDEEYEKEDHVLTEEALYFIGEHIRNVTEKPDGWLIEFDHFSLGVHPCTEAEQPWSSYYFYLPYRNLEHKLKRCTCGGKARLMVDHVDDYYICCDSCFRSTYADYRLGIVVKHWNADQCPVNNDHTPYESFLMKKDQPIRRILLDDRAKQLDSDHYTCDEPLLQISNMYYELEHLFVPVHRCVLNMISVCNRINQQIWPIRIEPEEGEEGFRFVSLCTQADHDVMTLTTGKRDAVITAMPDHIDIRIINHTEDR